MKRIISGICCIVMLCTVASAQGSTTRYNVGLTGVTVGLNDDVYVISADTPTDDEVFQVLQIDDPSAMIAQNVANGVALECLAKDMSYDISLGGIQSLGLLDFPLTDDRIYEIEETFKNQLANSGMLSSNFYINTDYDLQYIVFDVQRTTENGTMYGQAYYTEIPSGGFMVTLYNLYGTPMNGTYRGKLSEVISSLALNGPTQSADKVETKDTSNGDSATTEYADSASQQSNDTWEKTESKSLGSGLSNAMLSGAFGGAVFAIIATVIAKIIKRRSK